MRTEQHIIDTRSIKRVLSILPDHWVIRELTERDYGIDLLIEIFEKGGTDTNGHEVYNSTGAIFHAQVKGTSTALKVKRDGNISFSLDKKALFYTERFSTPFLLFRVDVSSDSAVSYFLWIQRYIRDILDSKVPTWRTNKQASISVNIPRHNDIPSNFDKIETIASRPRLIQDTVEFCESYFHLSSQLESAALGKYTINKDSLEHMVLLARQIRNLHTIFKYNNCCIDKTCAEELLSFVESLTPNSPASVFHNFPHKDNFNLLADSINGMADIENFIAEYGDGTVY